MISRRRFLQAGGVSATALLVPRIGFESWPPVFRPDERGIPKLRLFFDDEHVARLRALYSSPLFDSLREEMDAIDREAEREFYQGEIRYNDHLYDIPRVGRTATNMAFVYAMTDDQDAADLAIESIRQLMEFPKWDYFLEAGTDVIGLQRAPSSTMAVSIASDFLGDAVSDDVRTEWITAMGERGCEPCFRSLHGMRYKDEVVGWSVDETSTYFEHRPEDRIDLSNWPTILDRTNLKAVPASALAVGAVAYERALGSSETVDRWLEQAIYSIGTFEELYAEDGSYDENMSYANYTSEHLATAMEALGRGDHADLYDIINWRGFTDFAVGMTMPTTADPVGIVNFGDAGQGLQSGVPFWIASRFGDRRAQWFGNEMARGHNLWSVLWHDSDLAADPPEQEPALFRSELDWIVARTGYTPDDLVVAMRSGGPSNHEHADRNSLIVKCFGETLVADPYRPPYSFSDPAWPLRTTAGHSALLIDGQGHQYHDGSEGTNPSDARADIIREGRRSGHMYWVSDATPAYSLVDPAIERVTRTVLVLHEIPAVIVIDKVIKDGPALLQARYYADNIDGSAVIDSTERTFISKRPGARAVGLGVASGGSVMRQGMLEIPDEVAAQHPFVDVAMIGAADDPIMVTLLLPQRTDMTLSTGRVVEADDGNIEVRIQSGLRPALCTIRDSGPIPEFEIEFS